MSSTNVTDRQKSPVFCCKKSGNPTRDTSAPVPKCPGHFGTGAEVSEDTSASVFGTDAEVSWGRSVLGPKCLVTEIPALYFAYAVTMPPKKFVGTIRRFAKPPTDVTYFNIHSMHSPQSHSLQNGCHHLSPWNLNVMYHRNQSKW